MDGGLYKNIKMSVRAADTIILIGIVILIAVTAVMVTNGGFTVEFNTNGGTDRKTERYMYGEKIEAIEPYKEGFCFGGWYLDKNCTIPFNIATETVSESMTLYAKWE